MRGGARRQDEPGGGQDTDAAADTHFREAAGQLVQIPTTHRSGGSRWGKKTREELESYLRQKLAIGYLTPMGHSTIRGHEQTPLVPIL